MDIGNAILLELTVQPFLCIVLAALVRWPNNVLCVVELYNFLYQTLVAALNNSEYNSRLLRLLPLRFTKSPRCLRAIDINRSIKYFTHARSYDKLSA